MYFDYCPHLGYSIPLAIVLFQIAVILNKLFFIPATIDHNQNNNYKHTEDLFSNQKIVNFSCSDHPRTELPCKKKNTTKMSPLIKTSKTNKYCTQ